MGTSDISRKPATDQLTALQSREISSVELLDEHVERHKMLHSRLNAVVTTDIERARQQAAKIDDARSNGVDLGPLAGRRN
ncbi:MAG: hypothetical protein EBS76_01675 [Actinobacteria bacterium]|nr:hypothetical protein [Actinomycetota bacterium]